MKIKENDELLLNGNYNIPAENILLTSTTDQLTNRREHTQRANVFRVAGLFAGIGGLEEGFRQAGHKSSMLCEFDSAAQKVLQAQFIGTEITTDVRAIASLPDCDVLTAGFPCQDLSQVGQRKGLSGPNSGLIEHVFRLLERQKRTPRWVVLENVPFMLTLNGGHAIRAITSTLEEMGYAWAYRTVNTQAFGLPQRRRRVILIASQSDDPRPPLLATDVEPALTQTRGVHACGFYWTEGNTGLGWAVDALPPLKGGSALHIPSPPAIWFPRRRLIAMPTIEDAERLQGFVAGWTNISDDPAEARKRWRMVGNAVSVPVAKWLADRLTAPHPKFSPRQNEIQPLPTTGGWPSAAWSYKGQRSKAQVSDWPIALPRAHLASFLKRDVVPLSKKATSGFLSRLVKSKLKYEEAFRLDLIHHVENAQ